MSLFDWKFTKEYAKNKFPTSPRRYLLVIEHGSQKENRLFDDVSDAVKYGSKIDKLTYICKLTITDIASGTLLAIKYVEDNV